MFSIYLSMSLMGVLLSPTATDVSCLSQFCCCTCISWDAQVAHLPKIMILLPVPVLLWGLHLKCQHLFTFRMLFVFPEVICTCISSLLFCCMLKKERRKKKRYAISYQKLELQYKNWNCSFHLSGSPLNSQAEITRQQLMRQSLF